MDINNKKNEDSEVEVKEIIVNAMQEFNIEVKEALQELKELGEDKK